MHSDPPDKGSRVVAVLEQQLEGVKEYQHELNLEVKHFILCLVFFCNLPMSKENRFQKIDVGFIDS